VSSAAYLGEILTYDNRKFQSGGVTIYTGFADQGVITLDANGNLYVSNAGEVYEYAPYTNQLFFVYDPLVAIDMATDIRENLYVDTGSQVVEYPQGSGTISNACEVEGTTGVTVGRNGAVFVAFGSSGIGRIAEFPRGLAGCNGILLGAKFELTGGMAVDKAGNLIVCDQTAGTVDIVPPPYTTISRTINSPGQPLHVTLDKGNRRIFVEDGARSVVQVLDYPSGTLVTELSGIHEVRGVVDGPNAVY
jgi:hypothetical protein